MGRGRWKIKDDKEMRHNDVTGGWIFHVGERHVLGMDIFDAWEHADAVRLELLLDRATGDEDFDLFDISVIDRPDGREATDWIVGYSQFEKIPNIAEETEDRRKASIISKILELNK